MFLDGSILNYDDLPLVDSAMHLPSYHIQDLHYHILVIFQLEFIIHFIERYFSRLIFPDLDPLLRKDFELFSDINMILESEICQ